MLIQRIRRVLKSSTVISGFSISDVDWMYDILTEMYGLISEKNILDMWRTKRRIDYLTFSKRKDRLKDNYNLFAPILGHVKSQDIEMAVKMMIKEYTQNEKKIAREIIKAYLEETKGSTSN